MGEDQNTHVHSTPVIMKTLRLAAALIACHLLATPPVIAAEPQTFSPAEHDQIKTLIAAYRDATRAGDQAKMAALFHPVEVADFAEALADGARAAWAAGETEDFRMLFPKAAGAEYFARNSPTTILAALLEGISNIPGAAELMKSMEMSYLGVLRESEHIGCAVAKMIFTMNGEKIVKYEVIPVRLDQGNWKLAMKADLKQLVKALTQQ
jgi:hypothetical protein